MPGIAPKVASVAHPPASAWRVGAGTRKKIAVVGTGGSIATVGRSSLDLVDYGEFGHVLPVDGLFKMFPELTELATYSMTDFRAVHSEAMGPVEWYELAVMIEKLLAADRPDGIVIVHGTSTLEETAWFLDLTVGGQVPIVLVGAVRPANGISTDAGLNLAAAIRAASQPDLAQLGVVAVLNGEIHAARDVTKTSTYSLNAFASGELGPLGYVGADGGVVLYRRPYRPTERIEIAAFSRLPRVDVVFAYAGADGVSVDALVAAGARGLVVAGMAPGTCGPLQGAALERAVRKGVVVAFSSRAGQGRVLAGSTLTQRGFIAADNLTPQKARILLMLALAAGDDQQHVQARFHDS
ncbi:MAG: asparaginase family protein [Xanthobacteraceae bacterium]|jgi:L-asparaginase|nr:asparaginase family protein [Xanthobacteraceae bacterium]